MTPRETLRPGRRRGTMAGWLVLGLLVAPGCTQPSRWTMIEWPAERLGIRSQEDFFQRVGSYQPSDELFRRVARQTGVSPAVLKEKVRIDFQLNFKANPTVQLECTAPFEHGQWADAVCRSLLPELAAHLQTFAKPASGVLGKRRDNLL